MLNLSVREREIEIESISMLDRGHIGVYLRKKEREKRRVHIEKTHSRENIISCIFSLNYRYTKDNSDK